MFNTSHISSWTQGIFRNYASWTAKGRKAELSLITALVIAVNCSETTLAMQFKTTLGRVSSLEYTKVCNGDVPP